MFGLSDEGRAELSRVIASDHSRAHIAVKLASMSSDLVFEQIAQAERLAADFALSLWPILPGKHEADWAKKFEGETLNISRTGMAVHLEHAIERRGRAVAGSRKHARVGGPGVRLGRQKRRTDRRELGAECVARIE